MDNKPLSSCFYLHFCYFFFFFTRLSICSVQTNHSECNALVKSYMECAQYVVVKEDPASTFLADQVGNSFNQF